MPVFLYSKDMSTSHKAQAFSMGEETIQNVSVLTYFTDSTAPGKSESINTSTLKAYKLSQ